MFYVCGHTRNSGLKVNWVRVSQASEFSPVGETELILFHRSIQSKVICMGDIYKKIEIVFTLGWLLFPCPEISRALGFFFFLLSLVKVSKKNWF